MFDQLVVSGEMQKTYKPLAVTVSVIVQTILLAVMILIPMTYTEALPKRMVSTFLVAAEPPSPPPPPRPVAKEIMPPKVEAFKVIDVQKMVAPTMIRKGNAIVKDEAPVIYTNSGEGVAGVGGGTGSDLGGIVGSGPIGPPPPPAVAPQRIRIGGNLEPATLISRVMPQYPSIARSAHVSGTIVLHAVIGRDGTIEELEYVSGPALLIKSAMDAVKEWRYKPTLLNGEPVEVDTTVNVIFTLLVR
jgi:periplasmic protein TonB